MQLQDYPESADTTIQKSEAKNTRVIVVQDKVDAVRRNNCAAWLELGLSQTWRAKGWR